MPKTDDKPAGKWRREVDPTDLRAGQFLRAKRLSKIMDGKPLTAERLCALAVNDQGDHPSKWYISHIENGKFSLRKSSYLPSFVKILGITQAELAEHVDPRLMVIEQRDAAPADQRSLRNAAAGLGLRPIPVLPAGAGPAQFDAATDEVMVLPQFDKPIPPRLVGLKVVGTSMTPRLCHDDIVLLDADDSKAVPGKLVAIAFPNDEGVLVKEFLGYRDDTIMFRSTEPGHPPVEFAPEGSRINGVAWKVLTSSPC